MSADKEYCPKVLADVTSHISNITRPMRLKFYHSLGDWGGPPPVTVWYIRIILIDQHVHILETKRKNETGGTRDIYFT